ncbi:MAG: class I SAM-dependent methyltransferase [Candidatus Bathyarchaeia archaeon]
MHLNREEIERELVGSLEWHYFSPSSFAQYCALVPLIKRYVRGKTIDLGCGFMPFQRYLKEAAAVYHTLDLYPRSPYEITYIGDIQDMSMIMDDSYDCALCLEVLEHVPRPARAIREIYRILKPGGLLIFSTPYLCRIHDQPHDYFRFTVYGLNMILAECQFKIIEIKPRGGLMSFLGHQVSTVLLTTAWSFKEVFRIAWVFNKWMVTRLWYEMDRILGHWDIFPLGYVGVAQKPISPSSDKTGI